MVARSADVGMQVNSWKDKLDTFDLGIYEPPSSGSPMMDTTLTNMIKQSYVLREAIELGLAKLDSSTRTYLRLRPQLRMSRLRFTRKLGPHP